MERMKEAKNKESKVLTSRLIVFKGESLGGVGRGPGDSFPGLTHFSNSEIATRPN